MFADPQTVASQSLVRIGSPTPATRGSFKSSDDVYNFDIVQNSTKTRKRREFRFTKNAVAADPISAVNKAISASVIVAVDEPWYGFTDAELVTMVTGLCTWLTASTNAKLEQLLDGEL